MSMNGGVPFKEFLAKRGSSDRDHVQARLTFLQSVTSRHRDAVENLYAELNVLPAVWAQLVEALRATESRRDELELAIQRVFRRSILQGPVAIGLPATRILGRAITLTAFAKQGVRAKLFPTPEYARKAARRCSRMRLSTIQATWKRKKLGEYAMWGFFQPHEGVGPFQELGIEREYICARLGLPREAAKDQIVCYEYLVPHGIEAKIPRVVEAYAGAPWNCYFRTQQESDKSLGHGRTRVWDELLEKNERGLPEIVHAPVTGDCLTSKPIVL